MVAASAGLLLTAAVLLVVTWAMTRTSESTSFTATLPGTLLRVELEVTQGDVQIVGGASSNVLVNRVDTGVFGHSPVERRFAADGVFRIESSCPRLVVGECGSDYRLTVPETVALSIVTEDGDVRLTAHRGTTFLATTGGDVAVDAYCGATLDATSRSGDIEVAATCAPERLTLRSVSGDVSARVPPGQYGVDAGTIDGEVTVQALVDDRAAPWKIQAFSTSGDVTVEAGT